MQSQPLLILASSVWDTAGTGRTVSQRSLGRTGGCEVVSKVQGTCPPGYISSIVQTHRASSYCSYLPCSLKPVLGA